MPKAITCVRHGKWKLYWTGWRHVSFNMLILIGQWYAVRDGTDRIFYATYPGQCGEMGTVEEIFDTSRQSDQINVVPSTSFKIKCRIKGELLLALVKHLDKFGF